MTKKEGALQTIRQKWYPLKASGDRTISEILSRAFVKKIIFERAARPATPPTALDLTLTHVTNALYQ